MLKLLDDIIVDGKEYTYVDKFPFKGKMLNCYLGDEYLFTVLSNDREYIIKDERVNYAIKEQEGLNNPEFYYFNPFLTGTVKIKRRIEGEELAKLKNGFIDLIKNSGMKVDLEKISLRLSKVNFYEGQVKKAAGIYRPATNSVVFKLDYSNYESKSTMVHEMIHACGGRIFNIKSNNGFIEGATQLTTQRLLETLNYKGSSFNGIIFDVDFGSVYELESAIIRQMEFLLNESVSESVLEGKTTFFDNFKNKYGRQLYRFLKHRTNRFGKVGFLKIIKYFLETQEVFFKKVFDKEIKNVEGLESAKAYVSRLKNFEYMLGNIPGYESLVGFEEYYEKKLIELVKILRLKNVKESEIDAFILNSKHEKPFFKTSISVDEAIRESIMYMGKFAKHISDNKLKLDSSRLGYYIGTCGNNIIDCVLTYDNVPIYHIRRGQFVHMNIIGESDIERTQDGFKTYYDGHEINLRKINSRVAINALVEAINKRIVEIEGPDTDLLICEGQALSGKLAI